MEAAYDSAAVLDGLRPLFCSSCMSLPPQEAADESAAVLDGRHPISILGDPCMMMMFITILLHVLTASECHATRPRLL